MTDQLQLFPMDPETIQATEPEPRQRLTDDELITLAQDRGYVGLTACCDVLGERDSGHVYCRLKDMERRGLLVRCADRVGWLIPEVVEMRLEAAGG